MKPDIAVVKTVLGRSPEGALVEKARKRSE